MDILSQLKAARVTNPQQAQVFPFVLYDSLLYPETGTTQLSFFQTPIGQGITSSPGAAVNSPKTAGDTNMNLAGQLPSGMAMLVKSVEVGFDPGSSDVAFNPQTPLNSTNVATASTADAWTVLSAGWLELNILQQNYVRDAPLFVFPPKSKLQLSAAAATTATTSTIVGGVLNADGRPWYVDGEGLPGIAIQPATNFEVLVKFPAAVATPSGFKGRMRVRLDGYVVRASQ